ncbi:TPA: phage holin family protein [Yersinia enterocolitica]|uniref:holin n=1 Tax=Yersinia enterocolitica TaxID=630 RepID=UPI0029A2E443|nr:phage holin family protein [Yersinia enterocolitica]HEI6777834.1 phage holin family protein [Yersinia enterocolitica]HEI6840689.1 phage holin family protein [Yersinia enterocolitica]HEI6878505.1 phage holin family protein [Yersinia enterocolitica]HEI6913221.1 phage holin family protein [Yersinia enterocolitica]
MLHDHERTLITLALVGAVAAMSKALVDSEPLTLRLFIGRTLAGSVLSMSAAALLVQFPELSPLAVAGVGAALGIAGYQCVEMCLRRFLQKYSKEPSRHE